MLKSKLDNPFLVFLSGVPRGTKILVGAALVILLILPTVLSSSGEKENSEDMEKEIARACSMVEGVGECEVVVTYSASGEVYGVAVLCEGGDSLAVRAALSELLSSLFGIGTNRIAILKIEK